MAAEAASGPLETLRATLVPADRMLPAEGLVLIIRPAATDEWGR